MRAAAALVAAAFLSAQQGALPRALETFDEAWAIVNRTYYDPAFRGVDWDAARDELRPEAARAETPDQLRAVINRLLSRLGESHFAVLPGSATTADDMADRSGSPGFDVRAWRDGLIVVRVDAGTPAFAAGLRPGDIITAIDGRAAAALGADLPAAMEPRMRALEIWRAAMLQLRGPSRSRVAVRVTRAGGGEDTLQIARVDEPGQTVMLGNLPPLKLHVDTAAVETASGGQVGVIGFNIWMAAADAQIAAAVDRFRGARGIVLDLRGNPGGLAGMIMGISGHFFDTRTALGTMKTRTSELTFFANPRTSRPDGTAVDVFDGPVAILIDGLTGSASECFAGGMQAVGRARVFGRTSMGQALPASFTRLPNGDTLLHAIADFVTAGGTRLEGRGVVPDEEVPLDPAALAAGRDPVLDAALAWIDGER